MSGIQGIVSLLGELVLGGAHQVAGPVVLLQAAHNRPRTALVNAHREAVDQVVLNTVRVAVRDHAHGDPLVVGRAEPQVTQVVADGLGGAHRRAQLASGDDRRAALLHARYELVPDPLVVVDGLGGVARLAARQRHPRVLNVRELRARVVAPDDDVADVARGDAQAQRYLGLGAVVVQARQASEVGAWDARRVLGRNQAVGVGLKTIEKSDYICKKKKKQV